ncbi:IS3 family transposase, partial [bacterium]|nr:IS3 family transposase [bacterium]
MHGISRQSFYQYRQLQTKEQLQEQLVLQLVQNIRKKQPKLGGRKLYYMLEEEFNRLDYSVGRDKFFQFLGRHDLLVRRKKKYAKTTDSFHRYR